MHPLIQENQIIHYQTLFHIFRTQSVIPFLRITTSKLLFELHHEKTCFLHMRKQRCDQHLCFHYIVQSLCYLNLKFQVSNQQPGLHWTWSETQKTGFLVTLLISNLISEMSMSQQSVMSTSRVYLLNAYRYAQTTVKSTDRAMHLHTFIGYCVESIVFTA